MKKNISDDRCKHEFALYVPRISTDRSIIGGEQLILTDASIVHRIHTVLRLMPPAEVTLFDQQYQLRVILNAVEKKRIVVQIDEAKALQPLRPVLTVMLPLLKREDLEQSLATLTMLGVSRVQLVQTEKVQAEWRGPRHMDRLQRVCIAAAEQSKQYILPKIIPPEPFDSVIMNVGMPAFFFDPAGVHLFDILVAVRQERSQQITLLIGPEGDLTGAEKQQLRERGVYFCRLTPTVLRAEQACSIGVGVFRSVLS